MEAILKEINAVLGVIGSFICTHDGLIAAQAMTDKHTNENIELATRIIHQTLQALEMSGQRVSEADFLYGDGRLIVKNLERGTLMILCARNINLPLLNLATIAAIKKIDGGVGTSQPKPPARVTPTPTARIETVAAPAAPIAAPISAPETRPSSSTVEPNALFLELEKETQRLIDATQSIDKETLRMIGPANSSVLRLVAIDPVALWTRCPDTRRYLMQPERRQIEFVTLIEHAPMIARIFERTGYRPNQEFNTLHGKRRLYFQDLSRNLSVDLYLDAFEMYHRLDLRQVLSGTETVLPMTEAFLTRLQIVETTSMDLSEMCAVLIEQELSGTPERNKIDVTRISQICAQDWGWYKTATTNLLLLTDYAESELTTVNQDRVRQRARYLISNIEATPKNLRWLTRASLGAAVRWYETPLTDRVMLRPPKAAPSPNSSGGGLEGLTG
jgi:predicted regulator of Ras-like GTPase activity (Roadblock/LC7/MglB family)